MKVFINYINISVLDNQCLKNLLWEPLYFVLLKKENLIIIYILKINTGKDLEEKC